MLNTEGTRHESRTKTEGEGVFETYGHVRVVDMGIVGGLLPPLPPPLFQLTLLDSVHSNKPSGAGEQSIRSKIVFVTGGQSRVFVITSYCAAREPPPSLERPSPSVVFTLPGGWAEMGRRLVLYTDEYTVLREIRGYESSCCENSKNLCCL